MSEKMFVGKNLLHIAVFKKNDKRTIYNAVYRDGKAGLHYMKRFAVTGVTRDKEYDLTRANRGRGSFGLQRIPMEKPRFCG